MGSSEAITPDLRLALERFDREADAIIDSFVKPLKAQEPPLVIYHYTDDLGLRGILETGKIWLTNIFNLNDPSELSHGAGGPDLISPAPARRGVPRPLRVLQRAGIHTV